MATALPFAARFAALKACGFEGAEIQRIGEAPAGEIARAAADSGLPVALVNVGMGDLAEGGPGLSGVPGREDLFRRRFAEAAMLAESLGAATLHLAPSRVPEGVTRAACRDTYRANVSHAVAAARGASFSVVIEPINRFDIADVLLDDLATGAALARATGAGLLFDAYHVARMGLDPVAEWNRHRDMIRHVQVSDAPQRGRPGSGTIDFPAFFAAVAASGYGGWIGAEYAAGTLGEADEEWLAAARRPIRQAARSERLANGTVDARA
ncbi:TIM barrel protein [Erythrobacter sp. NE805]|uniref:TIM barrel protein n=1 Tax=Erythrobacter sp. NE805 TaxID=3389875 RepID=UPI00396B20A6